MPRPDLTFAVLFLLLALIHETCSAKDKHYCPPSSCGNILNISYPFRLNTDSPYCGETADPVYPLSCEKNLTILYSKSGKFYVKAINYDNQTIRVADASVKEGSCSIPQYSWDFSTSFGYSYDYSESILFISCENLVNASRYVEAPACINGSSFFTPYRPGSEGKRYYYVKIGTPTPHELKPSCRIDLMALVPPILEKNYENLSYLDIHHGLASGIELSWSGASCGKRHFFRINKENQCVFYAGAAYLDNRVYIVVRTAVYLLAYYLPGKYL
ncbi:hypothetical protein SLEP1_g47505 [Rubroshorea leprosula]|uniref:Wall-associated receptor kinase galacturonan-binding domain-containing protein n=1 Tax=Rubroshorea leprosula TaxID=152421 RepID=A0AAV5LQP9_9ROSI|nr:hypothetical protein SLEP1_g47505 [Rubroshorea leprosula]